MIRLLIAGLIPFAAALWAQPEEPKPAPAPLAIVDVTVIDGSSPEPRPGQTVVIEGGRIVAVGPKAQVQVPPAATTVVATGQYLIPGLWDMHVHVAGPDYFTLFVANGVTGVREMHNFFPDGLVGQRRSIQAGRLLGPDLRIAYSLVDGPDPVWPGSLVAKDPEEARALVRRLKEKGADFVKAYTKLSPETYRALAAEAQAVGLPILGHVPESVSAAEAAQLGHRTMEHLYGIAVATSSQEEALRAELTRIMSLSGREAFRPLAELWLRAAASHDDAKRDALFELFREKGVYHCPTLTVLRSMASLDNPEFLADPRVKYMPPYILSTWKRPGGGAPAMRKLNEFHFRMVRALHAAGVPILAGTDCTNPYVFPGFSLHDELELLVEHGLSPHEALRAATSQAVRSLGIEQEVGAVAVGQRADLVLLEADPLTDIRHTRRIAAVILRGQHLERSRLDELLAQVAAKFGPKE
ncbi:MAG TPA: amidohydrolase family protein [Gemmatales bacterium]|nr:amidohydrolase family protein [Gemmatales bacterium]HMP60657.1 amidohydrolase family protein [Gemmatales bacterium]